MGQGKRFAYSCAEEIWDEVRSLWPEGAGMSYARLDQRGLQWPCFSESDPGTPVMHADEFTLGKTVALRRIDFTPPAKLTSLEYPFLLTTGRNLYQYNSGTQTGRTPNSRLCPTDVLLLSPADAARLGLCDGERVRLSSLQGAVELPLQISERVKPGEVFTTFHCSRVSLNEITTAHRDRYTQTPEYKVAAVRLDKALSV
jgi:formate dehydrogenase major subunit